MTKNLVQRLPAGFQFWETDWHSSIIDDQEGYKYRLLLTAYFFGGFTLIVLLVSMNVTGSLTSILGYLLVCTLFLGSLVYLVKSKKSALLVPLSLFIMLAGFIYSIALPARQESYFLLLWVFPQLTCHLTGIRKARKWIFLFTIVCLLLFIAMRLHWVNQWPVELSNFQILTCVMVFLLSFAVSNFVEKHQYQVTAKLVDRLVFDAVTKLPNKEVLHYCMQTESKYLLGILQVENFNSLAALFGYDLSDTVLQFVSEQLKNLENSSGFSTFQLRHNEFAILLNNNDQKLSSALAYSFFAQLLIKLNEKTITWENKEIRLNYRIGAAIVEKDEKESALTNADVALKHGKSCYQKITLFQEKKHNPNCDIDAIMNFSILAENTEKNSLKTVFQPIVDLKSGKTLWYESLTRIKCSKGEYCSIYPFLPIAKSTGLYKYISLSALKAACQALLITRCDVSINVSILDMISPHFISEIMEQKNTIEQAPGTLIFEILETDDIIELDKCNAFINHVKMLGCKVAIDDFGSGYSNLTKILSLPIDIIKIDGSLIKRLPFDAHAKSLVQGIIEYCRKFHKQIVAEYVENEEILRAVSELRIDFAQGDYFGKAGDLPEMVPN